ncbi:uncharacterized protein LOC144986907 isoform X2 [Oryzias latipes]
MSSLQSLRELISERLAAAAEEICRLCEGTIVQYEQELCRQRRLLDVIWKPQLQLHHIVLPQHWMTEEDDLCNQQRNFRVEQKEPEPPQIKEEQEEPEPPQIKEEPGELCISQDEDQFDLKQETDTLMEIPTYEEDENSEADLNNQQSFNVTDSQDEEGNQHEESTSTTDEETESTSTTDEETDPQNRDQRKRRDRSHVQSVDSSHMSAVLPQHWMTEEEDLCNQQRNLRVQQKVPEPAQSEEQQKEPDPSLIKEVQEKPQPPQIKEEPGKVFISQDEDQLDLKQETDTLMEIPTYEENENNKADLKNQQKNFRVDHEEPEPPQTEEEQGEQQLQQIKEEPEPPQIKEEPGELCTSQDEDQLDLKQETDTLMEIPTYEDNDNIEADLNNQQSFNVTNNQDEEGNQHEESTSTTDEKTDPQNRDQRKRRDRSNVQNGSSNQDLNRGPSCFEARVLTTAPPYNPITNMYMFLLFMLLLNVTRMLMETCLK